MRLVGIAQTGKILPGSRIGLVVLNPSSEADVVSIKHTRNHFTLRLKSGINTYYFIIPHQFTRKPLRKLYPFNTGANSLATATTNKQTNRYTHSVTDYGLPNIRPLTPVIHSLIRIVSHQSRIPSQWACPTFLSWVLTTPITTPASPKFKSLLESKTDS